MMKDIVKSITEALYRVEYIDTWVVSRGVCGSKDRIFNEDADIFIKYTGDITEKDTFECKDVYIYFTVEEAARLDTVIKEWMRFKAISYLENNLKKLTEEANDE